MNSSFSRNARRGSGHRLGLPRPSLDSMRTSRSGHLSDAETDYDSNYDNDYDDAAEEEEGLLSRRHGEAAEAGGTTSNRAGAGGKRAAPSTDQEVLDEYEKQDREQRKKARRKVHRCVTQEDLTGPRGLVAVRGELPLRFRGLSASRTPRSMASYSRRLVSAYSDWMEAMTNGLPLGEQSWKLRALGSKTGVKQCLAGMRNTVRDDRVERLLGLEKAGDLLRQLEDYYREEEQEQEEEPEQHEHHAPEDENVPPAAGGPDSPAKAPAPVTNPYAGKTGGGHKDRGAPANPVVSPSAGGGGASAEASASDVPLDDPLERRLLRTQRRRAALQDSDDDDDDEEEALFADVVPGGTDAKDTGPGNPNRRRVLDDDSDDEDPPEPEKGDNNDDDNDDDETFEQVEEAAAAVPETGSNDGAVEARGTGEKEKDPRNKDGDTDDDPAPPPPAATSGVDEGRFRAIRDLLGGGDAEESGQPLEGHEREPPEEGDRAGPASNEAPEEGEEAGAEQATFQ